ncbi:hypothetical protein PVOR_04893 [Paenibacillus vortex V453]|uniref:Uncharacterized protein n=1 Tax=Paenibacillus vortex V453 TaxID=715225 RepID=A0A2R9T0C6_9BACL|nr:hypothetical protein [Paenibacillus vortex]EFU43071.1 hypothetical protein PVOR_04893 [Paenibacillus vortex V453]
MKSLYFFIYFYRFSIFHMLIKLDAVRVFSARTSKSGKKQHLAEIHCFTNDGSVFMMWMGGKRHAGESAAAA